MSVLPRCVGMAGIVLLAACGRAGQSLPSEQPAPEQRAPEQPAPEHEPSLPAAPWAGAALDAGAVPAVYVTQWRVADNRASCALIAPVTSGQADASARAASFAGGWAVAYDLPELRSAFGVAGAGVSVEGEVYDGWPYHVEWSDGSRVGYGPEGGTGPSQLAFLEIAGQDCLYNVWSRLGVDHLEWLLSQLRFVRV